MSLRLCVRLCVCAFVYMCVCLFAFVLSRIRISKNYLVHKYLVKGKDGVRVTMRKKVRVRVRTKVMVRIRVIVKKGVRMKVKIRRGCGVTMNLGVSGKNSSLSVTFINLNVCYQNVCLCM